MLENIKKSIGLIDISNYFNEEENDFDSEWLLNDDDELKEKYPELFNNYKGTNLLV